MYNYKFIFRSFLVITFVLLIISPGCTFWSKANYREFGRQGFDELNKIKDIPEEYGSSIGGINENNVGQYIVLLSIIEERIKNANESFDRMEDYAITKDEKELANSLANYTDYMARSMGKFREMLEFVNTHNGWNISNPDPYLVSQGQKIKTEMETYTSLANLEGKKAQVILDRMPEYQKDFAILYELGEPGKEPQTYYQDSKLDTIIPIFFSFIFLFLIVAIPSLLAYYLWKIYKMRKKDKKIIMQNKLTINPDKKESSLEYLKSFDKLTEKEIVAFLYFRNNPTITKETLTEMFGEETIDSLIAKGHFREENVDQN